MIFGPTKDIWDSEKLSYNGRGMQCLAYGDKKKCCAMFLPIFQAFRSPKFAADCIWHLNYKNAVETRNFKGGDISFGL